MSPTRRDILKSIEALGVVAALPQRRDASEAPSAVPARKCNLIVDMFDPATGRETMTTMQIRIEPMNGDAAIGYAHSADYSIMTRTYIDDPAVVAFLSELLDTPFALQDAYLAKPQEERDPMRLAARQVCRCQTMGNIKTCRPRPAARCASSRCQSRNREVEER